MLTAVSYGQKQEDQDQYLEPSLCYVRQKLLQLFPWVHVYMPIVLSKGLYRTSLIAKDGIYVMGKVDTARVSFSEWTKKYAIALSSGKNSVLIRGVEVGSRFLILSNARLHMIVM